MTADRREWCTCENCDHATRDATGLRCRECGKYVARWLSRRERAIEAAARARFEATRQEYGWAESMTWESIGPSNRASWHDPGDPAIVDAVLAVVDDGCDCAERLDKRADGIEVAALPDDPEWAKAMTAESIAWHRDLADFLRAHP